MLEKITLNIFPNIRKKAYHAFFSKIVDEVFDCPYELNVIFVSAKKIHFLNKRYRNIDKATDILSFPISKNIGEMYICYSEAKKEAKKFDRKISNFIPFLFIHGCVHLKGYDHGCTMEDIEKRVRARFEI